MRNMKIKVENNLDEIVCELERLGFDKCYKTELDTNFVIVFPDKTFGIITYNISDDDAFTTLDELRSMNIETLKEMNDERE